jgi:hypothetical protein
MVNVGRNSGQQRVYDEGTHHGCCSLLIYSLPLLNRSSIRWCRDTVLSTKSTGTSTIRFHQSTEHSDVATRTCNLITLYDIVIAQIGGITENVTEKIMVVGFYRDSHFVTGSRWIRPQSIAIAYNSDVNQRLSRCCTTRQNPFVMIPSTSYLHMYPNSSSSLWVSVHFDTSLLAIRDESVIQTSPVQNYSIHTIDDRLIFWTHERRFQCRTLLEPCRQVG